ncbi:hypothetical protein [Methylobacterium sp. P1-11]|uniref:hypothetical protein n=1 Tax=Methylobacterium sp. P1-11 TaxID=2024616 RepID=UPI0011EEB8E0|nr:hypothetical protein [Methylobacterium sp. P1-11]
MSAETLSRIMERTNARLAGAEHRSELFSIGVDHFRAIAEDMAETVFVHASSRGWDDGQTNWFIITVLSQLQAGMIDTFRELGLDTGLVLDEFLDASFDAYMDRCTVLFSAPQVGGRA